MVHLMNHLVVHSLARLTDYLLPIHSLTRLTAHLLVHSLTRLMAHLVVHSVAHLVVGSSLAVILQFMFI